METKITPLSQQERDFLLITALHPNGKHLSNSEIGQRLGVPVNAVKRISHQIFAKLRVHSRNEAVLAAIRLGDIKLSDIYPLDELTELFSSMGPDNLRIVAEILRRKMENKRIPKNIKQTVHFKRNTERKLTNRERDVVILAGYGLTNKEIADRLFMSIGSVRTFLNRACAKLGVSKRSEVFLLALKKREISLAEVCSFEEVIQYLAPLGADTLEKMAQLLEQKRCHDPITAVC